MLDQQESAVLPYDRMSFSLKRAALPAACTTERNRRERGAPPDPTAIRRPSGSPPLVFSPTKTPSIMRTRDGDVVRRDASR